MSRFVHLFLLKTPVFLLYFLQSITPAFSRDAVVGIRPAERWQWDRYVLLPAYSDQGWIFIFRMKRTWRKKYVIWAETSWNWQFDNQNSRIKITFLFSDQKSYFTSEFSSKYFPWLWFIQCNSVSSPDSGPGPEKCSTNLNMYPE